MLIILLILTCSEITDTSQFQSLSYFVKTITVNDDSCNSASSTSLLLDGFPVLTHVTIGKYALKNVQEFDISSLPSLQAIQIGRCSLSTTCYDIPSALSTTPRLSISNCPNLKSISIEDYSFSQYSILNLNNLPSLETMVIGKYSFYYITNFIIKGRNVNRELVIKYRFGKIGNNPDGRSNLWISANY